MENKLKVYRAMNEITQEDLAKALGVTRQTIIAIEKNKYDPSLNLAFKIAKYFKVQIEDLFIYNDDEWDHNGGYAKESYRNSSYKTNKFKILNEYTLKIVNKNNIVIRITE